MIAIGQYVQKRPALEPALGILIAAIPYMAWQLRRHWKRAEVTWQEVACDCLFVLIFLFMAIAAWQDR